MLQSATLDTNYTPNTNIIAEQNDLCRRALIDSSVRHIIPCQHVVTQGISSLSVEQQLAISRLVAEHTEFTEGNDPNGEHDFGEVMYESIKIFWKINYYDPTMQYGSEDPEDIKKTMRVLTIMKASEY